MSLIGSTILILNGSMIVFMTASPAIDLATPDGILGIIPHKKCAEASSWPVPWSGPPAPIIANGRTSGSSCGGMESASIEELRHRSTAEPEWFWDAVVADIPVDFFHPYDRVLDTTRGLPWARWFVGGTLNLAHNASTATPAPTATIRRRCSGRGRTAAHAA